MFNTYTKQEMIDRFALKIQRTALPSEYGLTFTLDGVGQCFTTKMPVRFVEEERKDNVIAFYSMGLFDDIEPVCYAFLSEMLADPHFGEYE